MKVGRKVAVAVALSVLVAACGGDDDAEDTAAGADGGGGSSSDLVVGILAPLTGELGSYGEDHVTVYNMAADDIQESGLLPDGTNIRLVIEDEGGSAEIAVRAAEKLVEVDGVDVIIGPTSLAMVALEPIAESSEIPIISSSAGTVRLDEIGGEWLFRTYPSDSTEGAAVARYFREQGAESMSVLYQNQESAQGIVRVLTERFEGEGGDVVNEVEFQGAQPSYQAQVNQALGSDFDLLYLAAGEESAQTIIREIRQAGYDGRFAVNGDLSSPEFLSDVGPDLMEGACSGQAAADEESEAFTTFAEAYQEEAGEESYVTLSNSYDAVMVAVLAALAAGETTGAAIQEQLREVAGPPGVEVTSFADAAEAIEAGEDIDYTGPSGPIDFDDTGTSPSGFSVYCVEGGDWAQQVTYTPEELGR